MTNDRVPQNLWTFHGTRDGTCACGAPATDLLLPSNRTHAIELCGEHARSAKMVLTAANRILAGDHVEAVAVPPPLDEVVRDIAAWQRETFPNATLRGAVKHLAKEVAEIQEELLRPVAPDDDDPALFHEELSDAVFMIIQAMTLTGGNLAEALATKLAKNQRRTWKPADADGVIEHVPGGAE